MAKSYKRRQKFVDRQVQGSIVLRTATYWVLCMFTLSLMLFVWQILTSPAEPFLIHLKAMWLKVPRKRFLKSFKTKTPHKQKF